jgi:ribosomal protein L37E
MEKDPKSNSAICTSCGTMAQFPSSYTSVASFEKSNPEKPQHVICMRCGAMIHGNTKYCKYCDAPKPHEIRTIY